MMSSPPLEKAVLIAMLICHVVSAAAINDDGKGKPSALTSFRPVDADYNVRLQERCGNAEFATMTPSTAPKPARKRGGGEIESRLYGGDAVPRGRHPWATSFRWYSLLGTTGAIISKRHILTIRHDMPVIHDANQQSVMVGGVCPLEGPPDCPHTDMRPVRVDLGAYKNMSATTLGHADFSFGIIELAEDLDDEMVTGANDTAVICLPSMDAALPSKFTVYGWGMSENQANPYESLNNFHLREVEIPQLAPSDERCKEFAEYCKVNGSDASPVSTFCLGDTERKKHMSKLISDMGAGVLAWRDAQALPPYLFGLTALMPDNAREANITIVTTTQSWAYAICYYTGVCVKREWLKRRLTEPPPEEQRFDVFYDPNAWEKSTTSQDDSTMTTALTGQSSTDTESTRSSHSPISPDPPTRSVAPPPTPSPDNDPARQLLYEMAFMAGQMTLAVFRMVMGLGVILWRLLIGM